MAKVCILGHPAPGHVNPTLPVTAELVRRGERVTYFVTEPFREKVEATGAGFRCYGPHELFERNLARGGMLGGMAGLMETAESILPELIAQLKAERPDYLLTEAHALWGNLAAQILGHPTATLCSMFAISEALIRPDELVGHLYGNAPVVAVREGLAGLSRYLEIASRVDRHYGTASPGLVNYLGNRQRLNIVFTSRAFQVGGKVFGDDYRFVGPSVPEMPVSSSFPVEQLDGSPLIFISMGTMYNDEADLYQQCFAAFRDSRYQVVMAIGHRVDRSRLPEPPANFIVREYVPQLSILARACLFITHGGINSAHEAMLFGVPMIVLPSSADHHIVAQRVEAVGAGMVLPRAAATAGRLQSLATGILGEPEYRRSSERMGRSLREAGGYRRAVDEIFTFKKDAGIQ
ncbi:MAG TPA: macrolide family glycosyltransferase [Bryobacteraceae bacterium]|nr:macrolide family glycosyltransferase [Bryobacteraceae bacterium]